MESFDKRKWKQTIYKQKGRKHKKRLLGVDYSNGTDFTCKVYGYKLKGIFHITNVNYYPPSIIKANPVMLELYKKQYTHAKQIMLKKKRGHKLWKYYL